MTVVKTGLEINHLIKILDDHHPSIHQDYFLNNRDGLIHLSKMCPFLSCRLFQLTVCHRNGPFRPCPTLGALNSTDVEDAQELSDVSFLSRDRWLLVEVGRVAIMNHVCTM